MDGQVNGKGTQQPPRDLEFWDSVDCAKCHLLFAPERGPSPPVPFWLTECGHILCNSHLSAFTPRVLMVWSNRDELLIYSC